MSAFNTKRQNPNEKLENMISLANSRREKRNSILESIKADEKAAEDKKKLDEIDKKEEEKKVTESVINELTGRRNESRKNQALIALENRLLKSGFESTYNSILFEMAYKGMWIDDSIKTSDTIHSMYETFLDIKTELDKTFPNAVTESTLITNLKNDVMSVVKKAVNRIVTEARDCKGATSCEELDEIEFNLNKEEDDELTDLTSLTSDQIGELVKNKVLAVVQDEEKSGKAKADMFEEMDKIIKDTSTNEPDTTEDETSTEEPEEDTTNEDSEPTVKESFNASASRAIRNRFNRSTRSTLFESIMMFNNKNLHEQAVSEGVHASKESISNATLLSSVVHYTILETFNTLRLYDLANPMNAEKVMNLYK